MIRARSELEIAPRSASQSLRVAANQMCHRSAVPLPHILHLRHPLHDHRGVAAARQIETKNHF